MYAKKYLYLLHGVHSKSLLQDGIEHGWLDVLPRKLRILWCCLPCPGDLHQPVHLMPSLLDSSPLDSFQPISFQSCDSKQNILNLYIYILDAIIVFGMCYFWNIKYHSLLQCMLTIIIVNRSINTSARSKGY